MSPPKVFISATSDDLAAMRQVVKDALLTIDCHPVEQTHFAPDWREVKKMLRERISSCQALIHVVGLRYGTEPNSAKPLAGVPRRSYTQMEYHIGRELQRKRGDKRFRVYTFVCPEDFPYDATADAESDEQRELQRRHRAAILEGTALYETPLNPSSLEKRVLALREEVLRLRVAQSRRARLTLAGVLFISLALAGIGYGVYRTYQDLPLDTAKHVAHQLDTEAIATRLRQGIRARFQNEAQVAREEGQNWEAIRELERHRDVALGRVDEIILTINEGLTGNPSPIFTEATRILEQEGTEAAIAYLESHETAQLVQADRAAAQMEAARETLRRELRPLILQAELYETGFEWDQALRLLHTVANKAPQWFEARNRLGVLLDTLARYAEAEPHQRAAVLLATTPDEKATALNNLALLLKATNRLAEAEPLMRRALAINEASFGSEHPNVARHLNNLALLLQDTNRLAEAEPLMRRALAIGEASFGSEHPNVAIRLNNLAQLLKATNRLAEAEPLMRRALAIDEASFGSEHPNVARHLNNLAQLLQDTNRLAEAEPLMRRALAIDEASFGSEHPRVAIDLNNLAALLQATNRLAEAEPLSRQTVEILLLFTARTGHEHPHLDAVFENYKGLLAAMGRDETAQQVEIDSLIESAKRRTSP